MYFCKCKCNSLQFQVLYTFYKKRNNSGSLTWNSISNRPSTVCTHLYTVFPTVVCAEHWLRPHSDECPSLPRWDVPSSQTPSSHHAPVTVAAYSRAHHPQGPGQGGLLSHINIFFHAATIHSWKETCASWFSLSVAPILSVSPWIQHFKCPQHCEVGNEHITAPTGPSVPAVKAHYFYWCSCSSIFSSC